MHPRIIFVNFILIYSVNAYVHDERFVSNENLTYLGILSKIPTLDDLIVPTIDRDERGKSLKKQCVSVRIC